MFKLIKEYTKIMDDYNKSSTQDKLNISLEKLSYFKEENLFLKHTELFKIKELFGGNKYGYYIEYNGDLPILKNGTFNNLNDLQDFVLKNFNIIKKTGGLNFYFLLDNKINIFFQIHYQDTIIKFTKK